jgi:hypothetical protein
MNENSDTRFQITRRAVLETGTAAVALLSTGFSQVALGAGLPDAEMALAPSQSNFRSTVSPRL